MKRLVFLIAVMSAIISCENYEYDDTDILKRIEQLEEYEDMEHLSNRMNTNISSLSIIFNASTEGDYVTDVSAMIENGRNVGHIIAFAGSGYAPVFLDMGTEDVIFPDLGMKMDRDGSYYWTLYSAWLTDEDGLKVQEPPQLKIEEGYWYMTVNNGRSWEQLEALADDTSQSEDGFLFRKLHPSGQDGIDLTLEDGTVITLPMEKEYDPLDGYLDPDVYEEQDIINLTNVLMANMNNCNQATRHIMDIAYNFWKRRDEFIYCSQTALDKPWDYWAYVGFKDGNTGFTVGEGHGGYKRIDCSTFVRYVVNGIDYYSTPYFNALEWTDVVQGGLNTKGAVASNTDKAVCRSGKIYLRHGKKHILESSNSSRYRFTKIFAYDSSGKVVQDLSGKSSFILPEGTEYIRVEMKVQSAADYAPAVKGESPAAILRYLRIREDEKLDVAADCPVENRRAHTMSSWFDENGYGLEAYEDYNPLCWDDAEFKPGTVVFMGKKSAKSEYKGITHVTLYIGGGYIIHSQAPRGLLGGEGIMIDKLRDMELRYDRPFCAAASPRYHSNYDEEKSQIK